MDASAGAWPPAVCLRPRPRVQSLPRGHTRRAAPVPTSGLHGQLGHDPLGADDVDGLALVLALVVEGDGRDAERPR